LETDLRRHKNALEALQRKNEELTKQLQSASWKTEDGGATGRIQELEVALKKAEDRILDLKDDLQVWKTLADQLELTQKEAAATAPVPAKSAAEVDLTPELKTTFPQEESEEKPYDAAAASAAAAPLPPAPPSEAPKQEAAPPPAPVDEPRTPEPVPAPAAQADAPAPAPTAPVQPSAPAPAAAGPARKKLLVAEDDPAIRRIVEITLQKEGIEVISAENGQEGLQMAIDRKPDAILTDIQMPVMTGIELAEKLKNNPATRSIPVGFLTGQREVGYYKQALALGSTIYITKPFRPDQLMMFINVLLRGKKPRFARSASKPSAS
jgi:CheY-like chemotaxis protein